MKSLKQLKQEIRELRSVSLQQMGADWVERGRVLQKIEGFEKELREFWDKEYPKLMRDPEVDYVIRCSHLEEKIEEILGVE